MFSQNHLRRSGYSNLRKANPSPPMRTYGFMLEVGSGSKVYSKRLKVVALTGGGKENPCNSNSRILPICIFPPSCYLSAIILPDI